jgi:hypothetical protein
MSTPGQDRLRGLYHAKLLQYALEDTGAIPLAMEAVNEALKLHPEVPRQFLYTVEPWGPALKIVDEALAGMQPFTSLALSLYEECALEQRKRREASGYLPAHFVDVSPPLYGPLAELAKELVGRGVGGASSGPDYAPEGKTMKAGKSAREKSGRGRGQSRWRGFRSSWHKRKEEREHGD